MAQNSKGEGTGDAPAKSGLPLAMRLLRSGSACARTSNVSHDDIELFAMLRTSRWGGSGRAVDECGLVMEGKAFEERERDRRLRRHEAISAVSRCREGDKFKRLT